VGDGDELTPPALSEEIAAGIASARLVSVPDCGHLSTLERPEAVNQARREYNTRTGTTLGTVDRALTDEERAALAAQAAAAAEAATAENERKRQEDIMMASYETELDMRRAYGEHTCFHRIDKLVAYLDGWRRKGLF